MNLSTPAAQILPSSPAPVPGPYDFSDDWFSDRIPIFERFLGGLKDQPCRLLEIGSYEGRSAAWLINNVATHSSSVVETIDAQENQRLRPNLAATGHSDRIKFHLGLSAAVLRTLPLESYDFAYIDGSHWTVNVLEDAVHAFGLLKAGGIMAFDDYLWDDPRWNQEGRPKEAVDAFLAIYADKIDLLDRGYQVWIRKKLPGEITPRALPPLEVAPAPSTLSLWLRQPRKMFLGRLRVREQGQPQQ
jgi:hypothetical protein